MLRKLRQMALIQTRVIQKGERGLDLQSGVTEGRRPALHLLVFSKAHVQQLCCSLGFFPLKKTRGGVLFVEHGEGWLLPSFLSLGPGCAYRMN